LFFNGTPALFGLGYSQVFLDYYYFHEGMQSITDALTDYISEHGGVVQTGSTVSKIIIEYERARGIELMSGKRIMAKWVVAASDMKTTFLNMIDPEDLPAGFRTRIEEAKLGESAVCVFLATDIDPEILPFQGCSHIYFLPDYYGIEAVDRIKNDHFCKTPIEISVPCLNNPTLAPSGKTGVIISALANFEFANYWGKCNGEVTPEYYALKESVADALVRTAARIIPDLEKKTLFRAIATPYTYQRYTLNSGGSITGWTYDRKMTFLKKGTAKMQTSMLTPVKGLLQAGHWTVYPGGAPVSILSGRLAADYISKHSRKK
jgi:phytoene dehydrogenase-like protein